MVCENEGVATQQRAATYKLLSLCTGRVSVSFDSQQKAKCGSFHEAGNPPVSAAVWERTPCRNTTTRVASSAPSCRVARVPILSEVRKNEGVNRAICACGNTPATVPVELVHVYGERVRASFGIRNKSMSVNFHGDVKW